MGPLDVKPGEVPWRVASRVLDEYDEDPSGCWISRYAKDRDGYATVSWSQGGVGFSTGAHRAAWVGWNDEQIPEGMTVDHLCKTHACVNPDHLRLLSLFENSRRHSGKDWPLGQCARGHGNEFLIVQDSGRMRCSECARMDRARWKAKQRGKQ
jgi:hypothetical protein